MDTCMLVMRYATTVDNYNSPGMIETCSAMSPPDHWKRNLFFHGVRPRPPPDIVWGEISLGSINSLHCQTVEPSMIETPASKWHLLETISSKWHMFETPARKWHVFKTPAMKLVKIKNPSKRYETQTPGKKQETEIKSSSSSDAKKSPDSST